MKPPRLISKRLALWSALFSAAAFSGCQKAVTTPSAGLQEVLVTEVVQKDVPIVREWVGTLNGSENADVKARVTGYLEKRAYQEGGFVKKGDSLFEIDARPFVAALDQAQGQLQQAQATMIGAELDAKRAKELFQNKVISEQEYTNKTQDYQTKLAAVTAAQAGVEQAQLNLDYTKIVSPLDGIAGQAQAQIGDLVGTGSNTSLTTVSQVDPMRCYFPISEQTYWEYADELKKAMLKPESERQEVVQLIFPDGSVYSRKGKFAFVDRQVDPKTGTIQVAVNFPNPDLTLRPGQYVRARVELLTDSNALVIPQQSVSELQGGNQVVVVNSDNKAEIREVKLGPVFGRMIVVKEGLKAGERVIVEGFQRIRQGMQVSAKPYSESPNDQAGKDAVKTSSDQS
jgi:membrane fusion protein, multidrug efflux system